MKKHSLLLFTVLFSFATMAQDAAFGKNMVSKLASEEFWGRGYTNNGMKKAADYIAAEFKNYGLEPLKGKSFNQAFSYPVNTFPGKMELEINGRQLQPGRDFIVSPESRGIKASGALVQADSVSYVYPKERFMLKLMDKLTWSVEGEAADYTAVLINRNVLQTAPQDFKVNIENELQKKFKASNVCARVKGTSMPDSFIIITAHYDHLGGMGKDTYFPGANDNASGVALLMNLAQYYAKNPQAYSMVFIAFAGEEAGLKGSKYFTEDPLIPLKNIRFLVNTDLAGTGEEGITVVNATEFPAEFAMMNAVNDEHRLLEKINPRGKAANSDHYFFSEKGVPAFFFYTLGGIKAYHDVFDKPGTLPLNEHEDLFKLIVLFNNKLMGK